VSQSNLAEFRGWRIFMRIMQKIFKCFTMQICRLFSTAFWNFWHITRLSTTNRRWVINAQTGPVFFGPPCTSSSQKIILIAGEFSTSAKFCGDIKILQLGLNTVGFNDLCSIILTMWQSYCYLMYCSHSIVTFQWVH